MFRSLSVLGLSLWSLTLSAAPVLATAWPSNSTGTNIGTGLPAGFEPSGIVWDDYSGYLWIVNDEGTIARMQRDGVGPLTWPVSGAPDLESIAVTGTTPLLYLGVEYDSQQGAARILEYNVSVNTLAPTPTTKSWSLDLPANASNGMEGMTWVPNGHHPYANSASGGLFYASSQQDGTIYVYDVDLAHGGTTPTRLDTFTPDSTQTDISDLYYSPSTRTLFVLYDTANKLLEIDTSTAQYPIINTYALPLTTDGQEGVTLLPQCPGALTNIYIADDPNDGTHNVYSFNNFPQLCASVLAPAADATTNQASSGTNYGTLGTLTTDSATNADKDFLIKFSLTGVPTAQISRAQLLFYVTDGTDQSPQYCATSNSWTETGVSWSNQPSCGGSNQAGGASVANDDWFAYDLKSALQGGWSSFRFKPKSTNDFVANSRNAASNPPKLILWLTGQ
jgi:uncharacterized protein YjiK